jgi:hypothetical protein
MRQTNPICPRTGRKWRGRGASTESNAPNEPNFTTWHGHLARGSEPWAGCPCHYSGGPAGRRGGRLYKQTQFERKWLNEDRLWCIGHSGELRGSKANPRRPVRKPLVQTKPILRQGSVQGSARRQWRQTNPICPRTDRKGRGASAGSNAPNKPNLGGPAGAGVDRAKQSQTWVDWGIWGTGPTARRPILPNKANLVCRPGPRWAKCAKRTQFRAERLVVRTKPIRGTTSPDGWAGATRGPVRQTNPICPRRVRLYKQSPSTSRGDTLPFRRTFVRQDRSGVKVPCGPAGASQSGRAAFSG